MRLRTKTKMMSIRFAIEDWEKIHNIANKNGMWGGSWVRAVVLKELVAIGKRKGNDSHIREKSHE